MIEANTAIYINIDDILDTRLAVLDSLDPVATFELLKHHYYTRELDDWELYTDGKIKNEDFTLAYKNRNKSILKKAKLTQLVPQLKEIINEMDAESIKNPNIDLPKIYLNYYPYEDLNDAEVESIRNAVNLTCGSIRSTVDLLYMSPHQLTPVFLKSITNFCFMYDFENWKNLHTTSLINGELIGVQINAPELYLKEIPDEKECYIDGKKLTTPFKAAELIMTPFLNLTYIPVRLYSMIF